MKDIDNKKIKHNKKIKGNKMLEKIRDKFNDPKSQKFLLVALVAALAVALSADMYKPYSPEVQKIDILEQIDKASDVLVKDIKDRNIAISGLEDKLNLCHEALKQSKITGEAKYLNIVVGLCD